MRLEKFELNESAVTAGFCLQFIDESLYNSSKDTTSKVWMIYKCLEAFEFKNKYYDLIIEKPRKPEQEKKKEFIQKLSLRNDVKASLKRSSFFPN